MTARRPASVPASARRRRMLSVTKRRPAVEPPEPGKARATDSVSAARIGAVAALIGAVIGAFGAGAPAFINTRDQIAAEDARSKNDFLRQERTEAYVEFLDAQEKFITSVQAYVQRPGDVESASADLGAACRAVRRVELVGSPGTAQLAMWVCKLNEIVLVKATIHVKEDPSPGLRVNYEESFELMSEVYNDLKGVASDDLRTG